MADEITRAAELTEAERRMRELADDTTYYIAVSHTDALSKLLAEYDRRGAELERVHDCLRHESDAHIAERDRLRVDLAEVRAQLRNAYESFRSARTPQPAEPDGVEDGVEWWEVCEGLDVSRDCTGRGAPTYRVGVHEVCARTLRSLHAAVAAALTDEDAPLPVAPDGGGSSTWIRDEVRRARVGQAAVPAWARPVITAAVASAPQACEDCGRAESDPAWCEVCGEDPDREDVPDLLGALQRSFDDAKSLRAVARAAVDAALARPTGGEQ